jgi:hypothetical protein
MAKHVKGSAIANASSYKLYLADGTELATQSTNVSAGIDFDLSTIAALKAAGTYSLGVKAISGDTTKFLDSLMSNLVSYTVAVTPTNYTFTINPTPTSATVTLSATGYSTVSGTGSKSITVANGTTVNWSVSAEGYTEQNGTWTANGSNKTESITLTAEDAEYVSYIGSDAFTDVGVRVQGAENNLGWTQTTSGSSSAATDYLPVSSEDSIWIEYIAVVNNGLASGGFYDMNQNLVAPLYWGTFGIDQAANASAKFVTPENPVTIASVEEEWNCTIAYVRFIAWQAGDGNNTGLTNTEARIYYANGVPQEPTYTSYVGEDVFSFNKESFTNTGYTTSGSSSAYASDYLAVTPEQGVWLQYIFTMSDNHRCIGLFDSNKTFIKSVTMADFGLAQGGKFQTPSAPVKISSLDGTENVAYVRFVAWTTSDGGRANTEARIYSY